MDFEQKAYDLYCASKGSGWEAVRDEMVNMLKDIREGVLVEAAQRVACTDGAHEHCIKNAASGILRLRG